MKKRILLTLLLLLLVGSCFAQNSGLFANVVTQSLGLVATPTYDKGTGSYSGSVTINLSVASPSGSSIYTCNTSSCAPTCASTLYSGAITYSGAGTYYLNAVGCKSGYTTSAAMGQQTYTIAVVANPPTWVQSVCDATGTGTNSGTAQLPTSNAVAGNAYVVSIRYSTATGETVSGITLSDGTSVTAGGYAIETGPETPDDGHGTKVRTWVVPNAVGGSKTTVTITATNYPTLETCITELSNVPTSSPVDATNGADGSSGTMSSGNCVTSVTKDLIYGVGFDYYSGGITAGSGFTLGGTMGSFANEYKTVTTTGSYPAVAANTTSGAPDYWYMQCVAIKGR
jgi:hypothetical protein